MGKRLADLFTILRGVVALALLALGALQRADAFALAAYLTIISWVSDYLDGTFSRWSHSKQPSWLGEQDLKLDIAMAFCLLFYLAAAGFLSERVALAFGLLVVAILWAYGLRKTTAVIAQGPVYLYLMWLAATREPLIVWVAAAAMALEVAASWRRFTKDLVPEFFAGFAKTFRRR